MGCWMFTLWDNDECMEFLIVLFEHLGLWPASTKPRTHVVAMMVAPPEMGPSNPLIIRHTEDELEKACDLLEALTADDIQRAKAADPLLERKILAAGQELLSVRLGLSAKHLWTLIHMHVGLPVDDTADLDSLAQVFETRANGGTYNMDPFLGNFTGATPDDLEELRNEVAPFIRHGALVYQRLMRRSDAELVLKPMQMASFGPHKSMLLWVNGNAPSDVWAFLRKNFWSGSPGVMIKKRDGL